MERGGLAETKLNGRILALFIAGFLAGLALIYVGQESLVGNADFLDSFSVGRMGVLDIDKSMLFFYSMKERFSPAVLLIALTLAGVGSIAVSVYLIWAGFCAGTILSVLSIRYGIRGILIFTGGIFPQILLLAPAYLLLFRWCQGFQERMRTARYPGTAAGKHGGLSAVRAGTLIFILGMLLTGCLVESYVNPIFLQKIFHFF
nr:stage II sporulation protein M [uncultured Eisenbergiella sp.]